MSMTTELVQRMKAAALKAKQANDLYLEGKITLSECVVETKDHLDYSDNPNNTLALVEALEKAQAERDEFRNRLKLERAILDDADKRIAELEARTVKLPEPISVLHRRDFNDAHQAIYAYPEAEVNAALAVAGVVVEGEQ